MFMSSNVRVAKTGEPKLIAFAVTLKPVALVVGTKELDINQFVFGGFEIYGLSLNKQLGPAYAHSCRLHTKVWCRFAWEPF